MEILRMEGKPMTVTSPATIRTDDLLLAALDYARRGWAVFPVHSVRNGRCGCGDPACKSPAKHPLTQHGVDDASTDPEMIRQWWSRWPAANVGMACGPSGLLVLDIDAAHGGEDALEMLERQHGALPATVEVLTGGGGRHLYFRRPEGDFRNSAGKIGAGIDTRGLGGYVVSPPSLHVSGRRYEWEASSGPDQVPLADPPAWLVDLVLKPAPVHTADAIATSGNIPAGKRNSSLTSIAGTLQRKGLTPAAILAALRAENSARCTPPMDDIEVQSIAKSIGRYEPAAPYMASTGSPILPGVYLLSDTGNAERFVAAYGSEFIWSTERGRWLRWDGKRWADDSMLAAERAAAAVVRSIYAEADNTKNDKDLRSRTAKWAIRSDCENRIGAVLGLAKPHLAVAMTGFNVDPWALNCNTGVLNLHDGTLSPHDPADRHTLLAPVDYDPEAQCPRFDRFLVEIFGGNANVIGFVQRFIGICLTGDITEHVLPIFYGIGANGKSVLLDTITAHLGDYAAQAPPDLLMAKHGENHPTEIAYLAGRRLVAASEVDEGRRLRSSLVKSLTGDARLCGRFMRRDFFTFDRTHKTVLACNHRPVVSDTSHAIWRRLKLVPFDIVIPPDKQDPKLPEKLLNEGPGILAWAVRGCLDWQRAGLRPPPEVELATASYQEDSDHVKTFTEEHCMMVPTARTAKGDVLTRYRQWCEREGERPMTARGLTDHLRAMGFTDGQTRINGASCKGWIGLGLAAGRDEHAD